MRPTALIAPAFCVLALTVLAALPIGIDAGARLVMPQLPFLAIAHVTLRTPDRMPVAVAFAAGLLLDLLTHGPLGYWAFVYVAGHQAAVAIAPAEKPGWAASWLYLAPLITSVGVLEWGLHSLYLLDWAPARPRLLAIIAALAAYPVLALLLQPLDAGRRKKYLQLERGG